MATMTFCKESKDEAMLNLFAEELAVQTFYSFSIKSNNSIGRQQLTTSILICKKTYKWFTITSYAQMAVFDMLMLYL